MNIQEDYVSFKIAKLLKEKGFDADIITYRDYFIQDGNIVIPLQECLSEDRIKTPTLQMAMKWLRKKYNLEIYPYHNNTTIYNSKWWFEIIEYPNSVAEYESGKDEEFDTYEDAVEAAIKYCLENLI